MSNYRGISCLDSIAKIFSGLLLRRLEIFVKDNNILTESQSGFRRGYSVVDNLFVLSNLVSLTFEKSKKLFCFFIDFRAAFDSVHRPSLFLKLFNHGVSSKFIKVLEALYAVAESAVRVREGISGFFRLKVE